MDNVQAIGILQSLMQTICFDSLENTCAMENRNTALRMAIQALKEQENTIVLGRDYWSRYFDITEKEWFADGEYVDKSFCIMRKEGDCG